MRVWGRDCRAVGEDEAQLAICIKPKKFQHSIHDLQKAPVIGE